MILRRLTKHVKDQNWFAVGLDFLIVVLGVFIGLQVQQWAGERERRATESAYTARLHEEVVELQALRRPIIDYRKRWSAGLETLTAGLYGETDRAITSEECLSVALASVVTNPTDDLATLIELQESGGLSRIRDQEVLAALRGLLLTRARARDSREGVAVSVRDVFDRYPALIRIRPVDRSRLTDPHGQPDSDAFPNFECDGAAMRTDRAFLNDLEWTRLVLGQHLEDNAIVDRSLANLHRVLDETLGLSHEASTP
ncbi:MAG: hypothetical protein HLUCCA04_00505 [Oceanicaulis sp. HLUCCA04]|nr:MAG: hypothetical protein HLUCCA04_00505 [Oceanicaulis sp. HLUCCA04]